VIANDNEFDRMVAKLEALTFRKATTSEGDALAELLAKLIQDYDDTHHPLPELPPHKMITFLMDQKDLEQADLLPVFPVLSKAHRRWYTFGWDAELVGHAIHCVRACRNIFCRLFSGQNDRPGSGTIRNTVGSIVRRRIGTVSRFCSSGTCDARLRRGAHSLPGR
jgi:antitoxin component HigA of HigAB toxin-antitoxin module